MTPKAPLLGCIEAGGTKFVLGLARGPEEVLAEARIPTTGPEETLAAAVGWLRRQALQHGPLAAVGIASFGPLELDPRSPRWGCIAATPKPGWSDADIAGRIARELAVPVGFDTDVSAAALAEVRWGAAQDCRLAVYVTVGTGIGGGAVLDGQPLRERGHAEMGHFRPQKHPHDADFAGVCPFHGDCLEGLASGPAVAARWGATLSDLPPDHPAHTLEAHYLAQLCVALQAMLAPGRILLGGGVMATPGLLQRIRDETARLGAGYWRSDPGDVIAAPGLGDRAGLMGAAALALEVLART